LVGECLQFVNHSNKYKPRQYPKHIKRLLSKKSTIWRLWKLNKQPDVKEKYIKITNECKLAIHKFDVEREQKLLSSNNLGAFYRFVNKKLSSNSGVAPLSSEDSPHLFTSDSDKASLLNDFFKSAFTVDNGILPNFPSRLTSPDITISDLHITPNVIKLILRKLKINSAAGPDGLPPIFYNKASPSLIFPLSILFRYSFRMEARHYYSNI
jgi:hypothetical protein